MSFYVADVFVIQLLASATCEEGAFGFVEALVLTCLAIAMLGSNAT
jgi:hypothetical protein